MPEWTLLNVYNNEESFNVVDEKEMNKGNRYENKKGTIQIWNCRYPKCSMQYKAIYLHTSMEIEWHCKGQHSNHLLADLAGDGNRRKFPDTVYTFDIGERSN
jgi:hypothetical protein